MQLIPVTKETFARIAKEFKHEIAAKRVAIEVVYDFKDKRLQNKGQKLIRN